MKKYMTEVQLKRGAVNVSAVQAKQLVQFRGKSHHSLGRGTPRIVDWEYHQLGSYMKRHLLTEIFSDKYSEITGD